MRIIRIPRISDTKHKREVVLPDGRTGRLQYLAPKSDVATVLVAGKRLRFPRKQLAVISTHALPDPDGIMPCCYHRSDEIRNGDRFTTDPARVTCPGWIYVHVR